MSSRAFVALLLSLGGCAAPAASSPPPAPTVAGAAPAASAPAAAAPSASASETPFFVSSACTASGDVALTAELLSACFADAQPPMKVSEGLTVDVPKTLELALGQKTTVDVDFTNTTEQNLPVTLLWRDDLSAPQFVGHLDLGPMCAFKATTSNRSVVALRPKARLRWKLTVHAAMGVHDYAPPIPGDTSGGARCVHTAKPAKAGKYEVALPVRVLPGPATLVVAVK